MNIGMPFLLTSNFFSHHDVLMAYKCARDLGEHVVVNEMPEIELCLGKKVFFIQDKTQTHL